jgi:Peptidase M61 N-terminal domain
VDRNYPGIIELHVDATNVAQKIFKVHERIPVKPGPITLLYPQWLLGAHAPCDLF